jgi:hypothetical protein
MNYIINESKVNKIIYKYIDNYYNFNKINFTHPYEYDEDGYEYEDENIIDYYYGDYQGIDDSDFIFSYYSPEYYSSDIPSENIYKENAPILEIRDDVLINKLNSYFGYYMWKPVIKQWFTDNFELPVKTLSLE